MYAKAGLVATLGVALAAAHYEEFSRREVNGFDYGLGSKELYARDAEPEAEDWYNLDRRAAEPEPEWDNDEMFGDLYTRDAEPEDNYFSLYTRNAEPEELSYDSGLYARDAEPEDPADPGLYARDSKFEEYYNPGLYVRDAEAEDYFESELYARDAEPDDYYESRLYAREAEPEPFPQNDYEAQLYARDPDWYLRARNIWEDVDLEARDAGKETSKKTSSRPDDDDESDDDGVDDDTDGGAQAQKSRKQQGSKKKASSSAPRSKAAVSREKDDDDESMKPKPKKTQKKPVADDDTDLFRRHDAEDSKIKTKRDPKEDNEGDDGVDTEKDGNAGKFSYVDDDEDENDDSSKEDEEENPTKPAGDKSKKKTKPKGVGQKTGSQKKTAASAKSNKKDASSKKDAKEPQVTFQSKDHKVMFALPGKAYSFEKTTNTPENRAMHLDRSLHGKPAPNVQCYEFSTKNFKGYTLKLYKEADPAPDAKPFKSFSDNDLTNQNTGGGFKSFRVEKKQ